MITDDNDDDDDQTVFYRRWSAIPVGIIIQQNSYWPVRLTVAGQQIVNHVLNTNEPARNGSVNQWRVGPTTNSLTFGQLKLQLNHLCQYLFGITLKYKYYQYNSL